MASVHTQVVRFRQQGGADALQPHTVEIGDPGPGEVRVRQTAVGVNHLDVYVRRGDFEAAGVVQAVGEGLTGVSEGDRVAYRLVKNAYASHRVMAPDRLVRLPDDITDETAAAIMLKGMTAEYLLRRFRAIGPEHTILVHAASGGVGTLLTQWAKHLGAAVIGTVGSEEKAELARTRGVDHAIVYTSEDFVARVREVTDGRGVDVAYDGVGRATFARNFEALAPMGTNALFGWASGRPDPVDVNALNGKSHEIGNPSLGHYTATRASRLTRAPRRCSMSCARVRSRSRRNATRLPRRPGRMPTRKRAGPAGPCC